MPIRVIEKVSLDHEVREHILDCLAYYFDHIYGGEPLGGWVWGFIESVATNDGVKRPEDYLAHVELLLKEA